MYNIINGRKYMKEPSIEGYMKSPFVAGLIIAGFCAFLVLVAGCASTAGLGKRLLKAKIVSEENKGALAICTRANALMYGGGNIAVVKTSKDFEGTVEVRKGCAVKITAQKAKNDTTSNPNNPAEELLDKMFNNPGELIIAE